MSTEDIPKGHRWTTEISEALEGCDYCIVCLTPEAVRQPWVNFEAGAISKEIKKARVSPLLFGISPRDLDDLPLKMFQCTEFNKNDMRKLLRSINSASDSPVDKNGLAKDFAETWNGIREEAKRLAPLKTSQPKETDDDWIHQHEAVKMILADDSIVDGIWETVLLILDPLNDDIYAVDEEHQKQMQEVPRELLNDFASKNPSAYCDGLYHKVALSFWLKQNRT